MANKSQPTSPATEFESRELAPPSAQAVDVPAEMILQIATGMEDEYDVADRFGITRPVYDELKTWPSFKTQLEKTRQELRSSGKTFRMQMAYMAEDLSKDVYRLAKSNETTLLQKVEVFRTLAKLADLEPKQTTGAQAGPGFSITINFAEEQKKVPAVIDAEPVEVKGEQFEFPAFVGPTQPGSQ